MIDPDNPVVRLCAEGIEREAQHRYADALALYRQAWDLHTDHYEACIAAHYLARQQETLQESLHWNRIALDSALAARSEQVAGLLPSLYLNLGWSHEVLNEPAQARRLYQEGAACLPALPAGPYTDTVCDGITRGLERTTDQ
jgi:tetratricopeptide (TPR) repeat protein